MGWVDPGAISPSPFSLPPLGAIAAILLASTLPSILHLIRHFRHAPHRRDPCAEEGDLQWRTTSALVKHVSLATVLGASAIFMLTPFAERIARATPLPTLMPLAIGCALAIMSVRGIFGGEVAPAFWRGLGPFDRKRHPKSFRATLLWNGALAAALLVSVPLTWLQDLEDRCAQRDGRQPGVAALSACNRIIGMSFLPVDVRARALALRGRYHALNDNIDLALADFEKAVRTDPDDPVLRVYRAHGFALSGDHERFEHEVAAASRLGLEKGLVASIAGMEHLNHRRYDLAIAELTISLEIRPDNANDLVLRGIAYSESGQEALARRDFEAASKLAPADPARLRGMADFARERENYPSALSYINQYLRLYPRDIEAIKDRSDIYWKLGMEDESRRDDDRAWELQDEQATAAR